MKSSPPPFEGVCVCFNEAIHNQNDKNISFYLQKSFTIATNAG